MGLWMICGHLIRRDHTVDVGGEELGKFVVGEG